WHTYRIEVCAENNRGQSDQKCQVIRMNQHAPTIKPSINIKDVNALSKTSVRVCVPIPQGCAQETAISDCKVVVFENNSEIPLVLKEENSVFERGEIWIQVSGLNSTAQYTIHAMFCNRHGNGPMSNPVEFKIDSLEPSEPLLRIESFTDTSIKLRWRVKVNAGSVQRYLLFEGPDKTYRLSTNKLCHEIKGLTPNKRYSFLVAAEFQKAGEGCTRKESILMPCLTYLL
ncbi:MAG: fibronectin type III domain-containing protein, partial [Proteobacteria bacterium]|nr:fibronectin type III domain-containing protein [Pseudomonadota bacterium]